MARYENRTFRHQEIKVDGNSYIDCTFDHCKILYAGGPVPTFDRNTFTECVFGLRDAARNTLGYFTMLYNKGGADVVDLTLEEIRNPLGEGQLRKGGFDA